MAPQPWAASFTATLGLLLGADEQDFPALTHGLEQEHARGFQLRDRLAQVDDVDPVAGLEDERLHLGVPTTGLVSEMDTRFEQLLQSDGQHGLGFLVTSLRTRPAAIPRNTGFMSDVVVAPRTHPDPGFRGREPFPTIPTKRDAKPTRWNTPRNSYFSDSRRGRASSSCGRSAARRAAARWGASRAWGDSRARGVAGTSAGRGPAVRVGGSVHDSSQTSPRERGALRG
jgi:hypothetical protein